MERVQWMGSNPHWVALVIWLVRHLQYDVVGDPRGRGMGSDELPITSWPPSSDHNRDAEAVVH